MEPTNDEVDIELASLFEKGPSLNGKVVEHSRDLGRSLKSEIESAEDRPIGQAGFQDTDEKFMEVFTQLAKEKLEGMMGGLLEAMVDKLRNEQSGSKELDIEASTQQSPEGLRQAAKDESTSGLIMGADEGDIVDESNFWPFKDTKTGGDVQKEEETERQQFLGAQFDDISDVWKHTWTFRDIVVDPSLIHSLTKELATAVYDAEPLFTFSGGFERPKTGHAYTIFSLVRNMIAHISDQSDNEVAGLCSNPQLPVILARIEIYIILNFQKQTTIGMVLRRCFERQQLFSPFMSSDRTAYSDVYVLFMALQAVTMKINVTWQKYKRIFDNFCSGQKKLGSPSQFVPISSLNIRILALHMRSKEERGFRTDLEDHNNIGLTRNGPESHTGATFRGDDLQIHNLVKLGRFHIKWMEDATHHLKIRNGFYGQTVLMIYWFGIGNTDKWNQREVPYYTTRVWPENLDRWELEFTMSILFGYDESQRRLMRQAYASVEAPIWLWPFHEELLARPAVKDDPFSTRSFNKVRIPMLGVYLKQYPPYGIGGMQAHFTYKPANAQNLYYATFPYYGARLKHIREHMDRIQPKGFRGLLKDNRNSMPFYTFWFAVIFGGTSVFLALLSLVVSSVQTWAAYHPPNSSGNKGS